MKNISLLDCTLRDGGYVNDWNFGRETMICIFERLVSAGVDIIEVGFLDERRPFDINRSIQPDTDCYNAIYNGCDKGKSLVFGMIDYGTCGIEHIGKKKDSFLDGIRIIFKKPNAHKAIELGKQIMAKGYKVCYQMVSITSYDDRDVLDFVDEANAADPFMVSIVDTYGLLHSQQLNHYFELLDHNLKSSIKIGYHAHNNFQLAYSNCISFLQKRTDRDIAVDGTVYGMGKSAGNAPIELLIMCLNKSYGKSYNIDQVLEAIDTNIMKIYREHYWGYNLHFFLSASNDCHPEYIRYLLEKKTLSVQAINNIVKDISEPYKLNYNKECIEMLYRKYQASIENDEKNTEELYADVKDKTVLVFGPGKSLKINNEKVKQYVTENAPVVMSANFVYSDIPQDYIFMSNSKRYGMMIADINTNRLNAKIVATSNITPTGDSFDYVLNYENLRDDVDVISDNSLIMLLKLLKNGGASKVVLAGFDGFSPNKSENYYNEYLELSADYDRLLNVNAEIKKKIAEMRKEIDIIFLTPSLYEE